MSGASIVSDPKLAVALQRGFDRQNEYMRLMETGTDEDIWTYEKCQEATWIMDNLAGRIRQWIFWTGPLGHEFRQRRALSRAAEQHAKAGRSNYANSD